MKRYQFAPMYNDTVRDSLIPSFWEGTRNFCIGAIIEGTEPTKQNTSVLIESHYGYLYGYIKNKQPPEDQDSTVTSRLCTFCGEVKPRTHNIDCCNSVRNISIGNEMTLNGQSVGCICRDCSEQIKEIEQVLLQEHSEQIVAHTI